MSFWFVWSLLACGDPAPTQDVSAAAVAPAPRPGSHALTGSLVDSSGSPVGGAVVLACSRGYCQDVTTAADGTFRFRMKRPVTVALKADGVVAGPKRRALALLPGVDVDGVVDVGELWAPDLPPPVKLPKEGEAPVAVPLGDGLVATLDRAALRAQPGVYLYEGAARRLPDDRAAAFGQVVEDLVAVWVIEPYGTTSSAPVALEVPLDLPAGTPVVFRTVGGVDGGLSEPVPGVADGTVARTAEGAGIRELSYVVVSRAD